jgi:hypothetical protein
MATDAAIILNHAPVYSLGIRHLVTHSQTVRPGCYSLQGGAQTALGAYHQSPAKDLCRDTGPLGRCVQHAVDNYFFDSGMNRVEGAIAFFNSR